MGFEQHVDLGGLYLETTAIDFMPFRGTETEPALSAADMAAAERVRTRAGPPMRTATMTPMDRTVIGRDIW
jgi:hypothetical protein